MADHCLPISGKPHVELETVAAVGEGAIE